MASVSQLICLTILVTLALSTPTAGSGCFVFPGDGYLKFNLLNFNNNQATHYNLSFSTTTSDGLLLYATGPHGDKEALYIREGKLTYFLFNTDQTGIGGYSGGTFHGDQIVTSGAEVQVNIYRNHEITRNRQTRKKTGLEYTVGGRTFSDVDHRSRENIVLYRDVYIGGYSRSVSTTVGNFTGTIWDIREEANDANFVTFTSNHEGRVTTNCIGQYRPN